MLFSHQIFDFYFLAFLVLFFIFPKLCSLSCNKSYAMFFFSILIHIFVFITCSLKYLKVTLFAYIEAKLKTMSSITINLCTDGVTALGYHEGTNKRFIGHVLIWACLKTAIFVFGFIQAAIEQN